MNKHDAHRKLLGRLQRQADAAQLAGDDDKAARLLSRRETVSELLADIRRRDNQRDEAARERYGPDRRRPKDG